MNISEKEFELKDGRKAILRSPCEDDAADMLAFIKKASGETEFLLKYPEEFDDYTLDKEKELLKNSNEAPDEAMIACIVDGLIVGNCQLVFKTGIKSRHRASVAIAILQDYWNLGIGTRLFQEMIRIASEREHVRQLELDFIDGNTRARHLYEKMGFHITGIKPDATRLKDGTYLNEYMMIKVLERQ